MRPKQHPLSHSNLDSDRSTSGGYAPAGVLHHGDKPEPCEPSLRQCARELIGYLFELGTAQDEARGGLFSPEPDRLDGTNDPPDDSLEATLRRSCRMAARLVGEARTINAKLLG